ncbi:MAG TPA: SLBB domain-containing protein [Blastocatellia bacterium]|nr:SLBB domain-containing protein [Blastocatellia bacterium]
MTKLRQTASILLCFIALSGSTIARQEVESLYYITGAVRNSGAYKLQGRPSVLQLIQAAGGLTDYHASTAIIIREPRTPDETQTSRIVDISSLNRGVVTEESYLQPGEIVIVSSVQLFHVSGEVNAPGSFRYDKGMTLRQAISLAQGMTSKAVSDRAYINREVAASGERQVITVDLGEIMKGKKEDVAIEPGDMIVVPSYRSKSIDERPRLDELPRFIDTPPLRGLPSTPKGSYKKG